MRKKGFYWVVTEKGTTPEVAYLNERQMAITIVDQHLTTFDKYYWIGERIAEPENIPQ